MCAIYVWTLSPVPRQTKIKSIVTSYPQKIKEQPALWPWNNTLDGSGIKLMRSLTQA